MNLRKGQTQTIAPAVLDRPRNVKIEGYEWESSDSAVAECGGGSVRCVGGGSAVITCRAALSDGTVLTAECPVTVTVPVESLQAASREISVMAGETFSPEIRILPEDATQPGIRWSVSDESILSVDDSGRVTALSPGKATLSAAAEENPRKSVRMTVTVTRRVGVTDRELTFQGIPWESDCETCVRILKEKGFVAEDTPSRCVYTGFAWHWPERELLFSRVSAWKTLPVSLTDQGSGAGQMNLTPLKTVGGYLPQTATLVFLNGTDGEDRIDPERSRLIGVYFSFDSQHQKGTEAFCTLLERLEAEYGEFRRYVAEDVQKYYPDFYSQISEALGREARVYSYRELGSETYLGEYALCTIRGEKETGIMMSIDTNGNVILFYGRTDAPELIRELAERTKGEPAALEDAGI